MASIFSQPATFDIGYESPVVDKSSSVFSSIGTSLMQGLDTALTENKRNAPSYSQKKDLMEQKSLATYTRGVQDIWNRVGTGQLSEQAGRIEIRKYRTLFSREGVDVTGEAYDLVTSDITGLSEARINFSEDQILINKLSETEEGQGAIFLARSVLEEQGLAYGDEQVAMFIRNKLKQQENLNFMKLQFEDSDVSGDIIFNKEYTNTIQPIIQSFRTDTESMVNYLEKKGVVVTEEMIADQYSNYLVMRDQILSSIPATVESTLKSGLDQQFKNIDDFFVGLGLERIDGAIAFRKDQAVYDLQNKTKIILQSLDLNNDAASAILASKITDRNYKLDGIEYAEIINLVGDVSKLPSFQPENLIKEETIVAGSLSETYSRTRSFLESPEQVSLAELDEAKVSARKYLGETGAKQAEAMTNKQAFEYVATYSELLKGYDKTNLKDNPSLIEGAYNTAIGLSLGVETINFEEDVVSTKGLMKLFNANVPRLLDLLESNDPVKGAAARDLLFGSLATAKVQYDKRYATEIKDQAIFFNTDTKRFEVDLKKITKGTEEDKTKLTNMLNEFYDGDVLRAAQDNFALVIEAEKKKRETQSIFRRRTFTPPDLLFEQVLQSSVENVLRLANIRTSSTYLTKFANLISPQTYKDFIKDQDQRLGFTPVGDTSQPIVNTSVSQIDTSNVDTSNNLMTGNVDESNIPITNEAGTISSENQGAEVAPSAVSSPIEPATKDNPISVARWFINSAVTKDGTKILDIIKEEQKNLATADDIRDLILEEISNNKEFYRKAIQEYLKSEEVPVGSWYKNLDGSVFQLK
tara:strand:+ start:2557 stop:4986 length:2430 start_codon:yes stop_codon:yes gene_type:complete